MSGKIVVSFSGWCECDPDEIKFVYIGMDESVKQYITGREWLALPKCLAFPEGQDGDTIVTIVPTREDYILESCADAQATALEGAYEDIHVEVEEE